MMWIAAKGQRFTHRPQPMQCSSEIFASFAVRPASMHNLPDLFIGQTFLHSNEHLSGRHLSLLIIAILMRASTIY